MRTFTNWRWLVGVRLVVTDGEARITGLWRCFRHLSAWKSLRSIMIFWVSFRRCDGELWANHVDEQSCAASASGLGIGGAVIARVTGFRGPPQLPGFSREIGTVSLLQCVDVISPANGPRLPIHAWFVAPNLGRTQGRHEILLAMVYRAQSRRPGRVLNAVRGAFLDLLGPVVAWRLFVLAFAQVSLAQGRRSHVLTADRPGPCSNMHGLIGVISRAISASACLASTVGLQTRESVEPGLL